MQREDTNQKNAKLEKIRKLIQQKKKNQNKNNKKLKTTVSPTYTDEREMIDERDLLAQQSVEVDPNDPEFKHKLKYEDPYEDIIEKEVIEKNVDNEESDSEDYDSIDAEEIVIKITFFNFIIN